MFVSIAVARGIGPEKLGYWVYISWLTTISVTLGNVGIPVMAVKYMAEYYGRGLEGVMKKLYARAFVIQLAIGIVITGAGLVLVVLFGDPAYRLPSLLLVVSVLPAMANTIPTIANIAIEAPGKNVPGSFVSSLVYSSAVAVSLATGWGLTGIACGLLAGRTLEFFVRFVPVQKRLARIQAEPIPPELRGKMAKFSLQSLVIMVLGIVVWDRSEILFLKHFVPDVRQIAFYSVSFNLSERVLTIARIFGNSVGTTIRAQYGRDKNRLLVMLPLSAKYLAALAVPMCLGMAAVSSALIPVAYGSAYRPAIPVLAVCAILAIPKAFEVPVRAMLQSAERQDFLVKWNLLSAAVNIGLDWYLIPRFGAMGAAYGNGLAQSFAALGLWIGAQRMFRFQLPYRFLGRVAFAALSMAGAAWLAARWLPPPLGPARRRVGGSLAVPVADPGGARA
jgi:O-antigen/teichoic acid export membrane protein